jgi:hypothetical protein
LPQDTTADADVAVATKVESLTGEFVVPDDDDTPLWRAIVAWHDCMPPDMVRAMRETLAHLVHHTVIVATACSGTDLVVVVLKELARYWQTTFGIDLKMRHLFACEKNPDVVKWLVGQFPDCEAIMTDIEHLGSDWAPRHDGVKNSLFRVESSDIFAAGFVCKSRSKLNAARGSMKGCVQNGSFKTGTHTHITHTHLTFQTPAYIFHLS